VAIEQALEAAKKEKERPSLILVRTHIGFGSPNKQDTFGAHGSPLGPEEVKLTKENLGWPIEPSFLIPTQALDHFRQALNKGAQIEKEWDILFSTYAKAHPQLAAELEGLMRNKLPTNWDIKIPVFTADAKGIATRVASGKVMQSFFNILPSFIGGSADLNTSTNTELKDAGNFEHPSMAVGDLQGAAGGGWSYAGRNLQFGVREHGMAAICNGLAAYGGIRPFCATFLVFSDYMRPSIRLSAIMDLNVVYVFTHDSIALGEDGTTHQPIEQMASLRAIPRLIVIRPADANEAAMAWRMAIMNKDKPVALILTRQNLPTLDRAQFAPADGLHFGAYILEDSPKPELILIANGSELHLIVEAALLLKKENIRIRLVSMPSWELFEAQSEEYRNSVFPPAITNRIAVEAGIAQGWERYTGTKGDIISMEDFGSSAPGEVMMREYGFTAENVYKRAMLMIKKNKHA
jgi:transketolase